MSTGVFFLSCSVNVQLCRSCNMSVHIIVTADFLYNSWKTPATNFSCIIPVASPPVGSSCTSVLSVGFGFRPRCGTRTTLRSRSTSPPPPPTSARSRPAARYSHNTTKFTTRISLNLLTHSIPHSRPAARYLPTYLPLPTRSFRCRTAL